MKVPEWLQFLNLMHITKRKRPKKGGCAIAFCDWLNCKNEKRHLHGPSSSQKEDRLYYSIAFLYSVLIQTTCTFDPMTVATIPISRADINCTTEGVHACLFTVSSPKPLQCPIYLYRSADELSKTAQNKLYEYRMYHASIVSV